MKIKILILTSEPALFADRGFTAHEYLEDFKLYNMNGRLYDPVVGRFLNADPVIQDAGFTQNYNRYSYCLNNPLKYTDPSGMIHSHYWLKNQEDGIGGGPGNGGGGLFSGPGGENGTGEGGVYYDYSTGKYRTTDQGNPIVGFDYALSVTRITMPKDIIRDIIGLTSRGYYKWQRTYAGGILNRNEIEDFDNVGAYRFFPFPNGTFRAYNPVNPSTIGNNIFGLSYAGGDNPRDFYGRDSYEYVPTRKSDYPPIGHDRRYSNLGIKGFKGLAFDTRAIGADWRFVTEEYMIAANPLNEPLDRIEALGLGLGLGFIATPKTLYQLCQPNGMQEINRYYNISNIGVTNEPGTNNY